MPAAHAQLLDILRTLERHYGDMQDTEFTIEDGRLYMLQTRNAKRPAQAAVRFAVDAVEEGLLTRAQAIATIEARSLHALLHPTFDPGPVRGRRPRRRRVAGRRQGRDRLHCAGGGRGRRGGARGHPRAALHRGRRRRGLPRREGHPHLRGRQGVARGARGAWHGPPRGHRRRRAGRRPACPRGAHRRARAARGRSDRHRRNGRRHHARRRRARHAGGGPRFETVLGWCDELRTLGVRANADTPEDARRARPSAPRASGCAGPSTCSWPPTASRRCSA